ncbi:MAG: DUF2189 domain-containing protein [Caulobacterales bacterium]|nr:DUF2189 domain-containing protein [Caulobacterales bacterium]
MSTLPAVEPRHPPAVDFNRHMPVGAAFGWLAAGWRDFWKNPLASLLYGLLVAAVSAAIVWGLFALKLDYILFPALAGFLVVGPILAIGLYEKSRRIAAGEKVRFFRMVFVRAASGYQVLFAGVLLSLLALLWMRAAVIVYALFFGVRAFPGIDHIAEMLLTTPTGWAMLLVGTAVGGLFAAFAFAISVLAIPMLLAERTDALTAMGLSMARVWANRPVMIAWGAIVCVLSAFSIATGFIGLIIVFPVLGHGVWHAYRALTA